MKQINSMDEWRALAAELQEDGYSLSSWQYAWNEPPGFHAWFWASGHGETEVMTRDEKVHEAIIAYKAK
jgi:hypothetical protein